MVIQDFQRVITTTLFLIFSFSVVLFIDKWRATSVKIEAENTAASIMNYALKQDGSKVGVITIGKEAKITSVSSWVEKVTGYDEAEMLGRELGFLMPIVQAHRHKEKLHDAFHKKEITINHVECSMVGDKREPLRVFVFMIFSPAHQSGFAIISIKKEFEYLTNDVDDNL